LIRFDAEKGTLDCLISGVEDRILRTKDNRALGMGRELFMNMRNTVSSSEEGASFLN